MEWMQDRIKTAGHVRVRTYASITTRQFAKD